MWVILNVNYLPSVLGSNPQRMDWGMKRIKENPDLLLEKVQSENMPASYKMSGGDLADVQNSNHPYLAATIFNNLQKVMAKPISNTAINSMSFGNWMPPTNCYPFLPLQQEMIPSTNQLYLAASTSRHPLQGAFSPQFSTPNPVNPISLMMMNNTSSHMNRICSNQNILPQTIISTRTSSSQSSSSPVSIISSTRAQQDESGTNSSVRKKRR